jgi:division protein CdvB (Snf7/Vps24/ESCRT-III family)
MKTVKNLSVEETANIIRYMVEDMFNSVSDGVVVDLDTFEKNVEKLIKSVRKEK